MKLIELKKEEYEKFVKPHKLKSHFLQSFYWGAFSREKKNLTPYYLGLIDDNNKMQAACLLLQKKLPLGYSYFYSPRGFVIDFEDKEKLEIMTKEINKFTKKKKSIFFKIDPDIIRKKYNYLGEEIKLKHNPEIIFKNITNCGFKHLGFTKNFETTQPRYTFRINLEQSLEDIENHFSKTTKARINKAKKLGCEVKIGTENDINTFYHLMTLTEDRKDFVSYPKDYYEKQYKIFNEANMVKLFLGIVDTRKIIKNLEKNNEEINTSINNLGENITSKNGKTKLKELKNRLEKNEKEIKKYKEAAKDYGDKITLNAHMIILYNDKAWVLYAGNHNILTESYANYLTYYEHLKYCKEHNIKIYDQFGTIGDLRKDNPRLGLHEFKKKFGGDYIEFLGEFDYIQNHLMYFIFTKLVPIYRKLVKKRGKKELKNEVKNNK